MNKTFELGRFWGVLLSEDSELPKLFGWKTPILINIFGTKKNEVILYN